MRDYLPHRSLLLLLAVLALVIAPHLLRLPAWESACVVAIVAWRALASMRQWPLPPRLLKLALALAAFAAVYASYGRISGQNAGVAMLVLMLALKLTEMRSRRDVIMVVFILYFLLLTHFLFSQEIWTIAYLLFSAVAITTVLIDAHHPSSPIPLPATARMGGMMILQALPIMLLMFVLFPRIPGPLWGLPSDAGAARSGLSDSMTPGDIVSLIQSDEIAFRVRFEGTPPPPEQVYWRGPVFRNFHFRTWSSAPADLRGTPPTIELLGPRLRYTLTLEPMRSHWLFALDMPDATAIPPEAHIEPAGTLVLRKPVSQRRLVDGVSSLRYRLAADADYEELVANTSLQRGWNPKTVALGQRWRNELPSPEAVVDRALRMFREDAFNYTLQPPPLDRDSVDDFLFNTRSGFCEHYASSFAVLMRAAGIPTRVVTGYQGMERNDLGDYYVVRQSDAHAWTEVWLEGRGWVRIDPTAAVAPERVQRGLRNALGAEEGLPGFLSGYGTWRYRLEARWDMVNARWNEWVLGYGPEMQAQLLSRFGLADMRNMLLSLTIGVSALLALFGLYSLRRALPPPETDPAVIQWRRLTRKLGRFGYPQGPSEGPRDYVKRVCNREPSLEPVLQPALQAYLQLRYGMSGSEEQLAVLRRSSRAVRRPTD